MPEPMLARDPQPWARLYMDESPESEQALRLLRDAGLSVLAIKATGAVGPELKLGANVRRDLDGISELVRGLNGHGG